MPFRLAWPLRPTMMWSCSKIPKGFEMSAISRVIAISAWEIKFNFMNSLYLSYIYLNYSMLIFLNKLYFLFFIGQKNIWILISGVFSLPLKKDLIFKLKNKFLKCLKTKLKIKNFKITFLSSKIFCFFILFIHIYCF